VSWPLTFHARARSLARCSPTTPFGNATAATLRAPSTNALAPPTATVTLASWRHVAAPASAAVQPTA
jgi:hypothetical protein